MPCGAAVDTNGLKSSVMVVSGELSMVSVFIALAVGEPLPPLDGDPDDEHAPRAAASRPTAPTAMSFLGLRWLTLIFTFPVQMPNIPRGVGFSDLTRNVPTPFSPGIDGRSCDVQPPAGSGSGRRDLEERRRFSAAPIVGERATRAERAPDLGC